MMKQVAKGNNFWRLLQSDQYAVAVIMLLVHLSSESSELSALYYIILVKASECELQ